MHVSHPKSLLMPNQNLFMQSMRTQIGKKLCVKWSAVIVDNYGLFSYSEFPLKPHSCVWARVASAFAFGLSVHSMQSHSMCNQTNTISTTSNQFTSRANPNVSQDKSHARTTHIDWYSTSGAARKSENKENLLADVIKFAVMRFPNGIAIYFALHSISAEPSRNRKPARKKNYTLIPRLGQNNKTKNGMYRARLSSPLSRTIHATHNKCAEQ